MSNYLNGVTLKMDDRNMAIGVVTLRVSYFEE